jgi:hypothetical protein
MIQKIMVKTIPQRWDIRTPARKGSKKDSGTIHSKQFQLVSKCVILST